MNFLFKDVPVNLLSSDDAVDSEGMHEDVQVVDIESDTEDTG